MDFQAACTFWTQWFSNKKEEKKKALALESACVLLSAYSTDVKRRLIAACEFGAGYALGRHFWIEHLSSTAFWFIKSCFQMCF